MTTSAARLGRAAEEAAEEAADARLHGASENEVASKLNAKAAMPTDLHAKIREFRERVQLSLAKKKRSLESLGVSVAPISVSLGV